jgi:hypothetical protein
LQFPDHLPDHARTSADWINDIILSCKPAGWAARKARLAFHAKDVQSWEKLPREVQDAKYEALVKGSFKWE